MRNSSISLYRIASIVLIITALVLGLSISAVAAPRQHVVLEHFTNTGCDPCALNNPTLHSAMAAMTRDTVVKISVHTWWPSALDPFYQWNTSDNSNRTNYYGISSVPKIKIDGILDTNYPFNATDIRNRVRSRYNTVSPCTIALNAYAVGTSRVYFEGQIDAEADITGMRLFVTLTNDLITYATAPGSNGETSFPDPMRDMYPNANVGETMTAAPGNPYVFSGTLNRSAAWDEDNLTVVAFVQNASTHEIVQGTWTDALPFALTSPVGGEVWTYPESHEITWNAGYADGNVLIEINRSYPSGDWETLFASTPDDGSELWAVSGPPGSSCRIRLTSTTNPMITDISSLNFTIRVPSITLLSPNGGESLNGELPSSIHWTSAALSGDILVELNRYYPSGSWDTIAIVPHTDTSVSLTLNPPPTSHARLRLTSSNEPFASDTSDGDFEIFVIDLPPQIRHYPHDDVIAGDVTFTALVSDDRSIPNVSLHYRANGEPAFTATVMSPAI